MRETKVIDIPNIPSDYIKTGAPSRRCNSSWIWRWITRMEKPNSDGTDPIYYKCRIVGCNWGMKKAACCSPIQAETHLKRAHRITQSVLESNLALTPLDNTMIHNYDNPLNQLPTLIQNPSLSIPDFDSKSISVNTMGINDSDNRELSQQLPLTRENVPGLPYGASVFLPQQSVFLPQQQPYGRFIPNYQYYQPYPLYQPQYGWYDSQYQRKLSTFQTNPSHAYQSQYYMGPQYYPFYHQNCYRSCFNHHPKIPKMESSTNEVNDTISALQQPIPIVVKKQVPDDIIDNSTENVDIDTVRLTEADEVAASSIFQQDSYAKESLLFNEQYWARNIIVPGGAEHLLQVLSVNTNDQSVDIKWLTTLTTETLSIEEYEFKSINSISRKRKANHRYH